MYPIAYSAPYEGIDRNRLTTFFRGVLLIPLAFVGFFYLMAAYVMAVIAWFTIVVTGRYHASFYPLNAGVVHFAARVNGYAYLLTDEYPPLSIRGDADYPIRVTIPPALDEYDRMKTLFRFVLLIPVALINYLMSAILLVCSVIAWFTIVLRGELPEGLYKPIRAATAFQVKAFAYFLLITEEFPPIWVEEEEETPRFAHPAAAPAIDPHVERRAPDPREAAGEVEQPPPPGW